MADVPAELLLKGFLRPAEDDIVIVEYGSGIELVTFRRQLRQLYPTWRGGVLCVAPGRAIPYCLDKPSRRRLWEQLCKEFGSGADVDVLDDGEDDG